MSWSREKHTEARAATLSWEGRPAKERHRVWLIGTLALADALDEIEHLNRELVRIALTLESTAHLPAEEFLHDLPLAMGILEKMRGAHDVAV